MADATPTGGRVLGDFVVEREIGRGGMGVVYRAVHSRSRRPVALKVLEAHLTLLPSAVERFVREAHAVAGLRHPNIVPVERVGESGGARFFAMELIDGPSLADVVETLSARARGEPPSDGELPEPARSFALDPFRTAARAVARVARALHHAHRRGILHRDVKPSNILLRRDGTPLLIDFGLVLEEGLPALTRTGDLVGSPYYVAPEQCRGGHGSIDARVDVYALGVVLYELLALRRPFEGDNARDVIERIESGAAPPLRQVRPEVPRDLEAIARRAMALRPDERYPTAAAFARDLELFLAGRPIDGDTGAWRRAARFFARDHARALAAGAALLLLAGAGALWRARNAAPRDALALASARLGLESEATGVEAELYRGDVASGEAIAVLLPQRAPLALAPGRWSLRARASGHEALVLEGERSFELAPGEVARRNLWLPPLVARFDVACDDLAAEPAAGDVDGDGREELLVAQEDGTLTVVERDGRRRPFAKVDGQPCVVAVARARPTPAPPMRPAPGDARVAVAARSGNSERVLLLDAGGAVVAQLPLHGSVSALLDAGERDGGGPCWYALTDLGDVERIGDDFGPPRPAAAAVGAAMRVLAQLKCEAGENGRPRVRSGARLFLLRSQAGGDVLAFADRVGLQMIGLAESGALELRASLALPVRRADAIRAPEGDRLALVLEDGRLRVVDARGAIAAEFAVGECEEFAVARRDGEPLYVAATARALEGFGADGARSFTLPLGERIGALRTLAIDRSGDDAIAALLDGRRCLLWSSDHDVLFEAGRDVRDFCIVPPAPAGAPHGDALLLPVRGDARLLPARGNARLLIVERGDTLELLAADGRALATRQLPSEVTVLAGGAAIRCGASDGFVRELRCDGDQLAVVPQQRPLAGAITAIAAGALGDDGAPRIVSGDATGALDFALPDGSGDARFAPPRGKPVRLLVAGPVGESVQTVALLDDGRLLRFEKGGVPARPLELGRECSALALIDLDGDGRQEIVVALEGGELLLLDAAGNRRGVVHAPATVTALLALPRARAGAPLALAGTAGGALLAIGRDGVPAPVATLDGAVVAIALEPRADGAEPLVAALTKGRAVVLGAGGERLLDVAARGTRIELADLDGDGEPELLCVDGEGRLAVRAIRRARR
jgi:hypothetical protein